MHWVIILYYRLAYGQVFRDFSSYDHKFIGSVPNSIGVFFFIKALSFSYNLAGGKLSSLTTRIFSWLFHAFRPGRGNWANVLFFVCFSLLKHGPGGLDFCYFDISIIASKNMHVPSGTCSCEGVCKSSDLVFGSSTTRNCIDPQIGPIYSRLGRIVSLQTAPPNVLVSFQIFL